jgi:hypothetical protein
MLHKKHEYMQDTEINQTVPMQWTYLEISDG